MLWAKHPFESEISADIPANLTNEAPYTIQLIKQRDRSVTDLWRVSAICSQRNGLRQSGLSRQLPKIEQV